jgi:hypothetical protein
MKHESCSRRSVASGRLATGKPITCPGVLAANDAKPFLPVPGAAFQGFRHYSKFTKGVVYKIGKRSLI